VPVIVTGVCVATAVVFTANVAEVEPAAIVTLAGTVAALLLLVSLTTNPPLGAALVSVAVPVEDPPPATLEGLRLIDSREAVSIVRSAVFEIPF
jgi:hypothetical protein